MNGAEDIGRERLDGMIVGVAHERLCGHVDDDVGFGLREGEFEAIEIAYIGDRRRDELVDRCQFEQ